MPRIFPVWHSRFPPVPALQFAARMRVFRDELQLSISDNSAGNWREMVSHHTKAVRKSFWIRDDLVVETTSGCNLVLTDDNYLKPVSPSISLTVTAPNSALFKCPYDSYSGLTNPLINDYFRALNFSSVYRCADINLYYRNISDSFNGEIAAPQPCVRMPFEISEYWDWVGFYVQLNVSDACRKCHQSGGQCGNNSRNEFLCTHDAGKQKLKKALLIGGVTVLVLSTSFLISFIFLRKSYIFIPRWPTSLHKGKARGEDDDIELFFRNNKNLALRRYKYSHLKNMTNSFSDKLGQGGYGSVYKGKSSDGRPIAVKVLNESKENGKEFLNELASISRTSHVNIVTLFGFCFEGAKRALVYEFMPNGSLEKYINTAASSSAAVLGWNKLFEIAVGIARGLEYLHQGCNTRILHFDIKPHNILLDKDFNPKISDFGLAKLCPNRSSIVSMLVARGTIGYIAPELFSRNYQVSYKSDVYSYGMMILEMSGDRKDNSRANVDRTSEMYFPQYIYKQLEMDAEMKDSIDLESESTKRKLIIVGLWCIQPSPTDRPSMTKVVEMLEGRLESLQVPTKHYIFSPARSASQSSTSESM